MLFRVVLLSLCFTAALKSVPVLAELSGTDSDLSVNRNYLQQRALDPLKLQTGLPETAVRLSSERELQLAVLHSNIFMGGQTANERLVLDGEVSQISLRYRQQIDNCWQFNIGGSWIAHTEGWFDKPLEDWHTLFGLPDAQRDEWPTNSQLYSYEKDGQRQTLTERRSGIGDVQLQVQRTLGCQANNTMLRAGIKLPVSTEAEFLGNSGVDTFIDVHSRWIASRNNRWFWAGSAGLMFAGSNNQLVTQKPVVGFGVFGLNYNVRPRWQLLGQLDWHTGMFESGLTELGNVAAQLTLALRRKSRFGLLELSFAEDVAIDTAPDIVVRMGWTFRF